MRKSLLSLRFFVLKSFTRLQYSLLDDDRVGLIASVLVLTRLSVCWLCTYANADEIWNEKYAEEVWIWSSRKEREGMMVFPANLKSSFLFFNIIMLNFTASIYSIGMWWELKCDCWSCWGWECMRERPVSKLVFFSAIHCLIYCIKTV